MEKFLEYNPAANIHCVSPTPLLMIVAGNDALTNRRDPTLGSGGDSLHPRYVAGISVLADRRAGFYRTALRRFDEPANEGLVLADTSSVLPAVGGAVARCGASESRGNGSRG
jgi:hypothetical protein